MMLFGNRLKLGFEVRPLAPSWERRYFPEQAAWAELSIWVAGVNLCRHVRPGSDRVQDALNVPLAPLADWLCRVWPALEFEEQAPDFRTGTGAHAALRAWADKHPPAGVSEDDWLDARERWWSRHSLAAGADGAQLPNLAFVRQDDRLIIDWAAPRFAGHEPLLLLSPPGQQVIPWVDARQALGEFVAAVASWLKSAGLEGHFSWASRPDPLPELEGALVERLSLFTGRPLQALLELASASTTDELLAWLQLPTDAHDPGASPVPQALRDLPRRTSSDLADVLADLGARTSTATTAAMPVWAAVRAVALDAACAASSPEEAGQLAADAVRAAWDLDGQPIADLEALLAKADIDIAASGVKAVYERMGVIESDVTFTTLLERYGVGARTAANQLWNRGWLSSTALRDDLIERHSALMEGASPLFPPRVHGVD